MLFLNYAIMDELIELQKIFIKFMLESIYKTIAHHLDGKMSDKMSDNELNAWKGIMNHLAKNEDISNSQAV